jgi:hypothetical protein
MVEREGREWRIGKAGGKRFFSHSISALVTSFGNTFVCHGRVAGEDRNFFCVHFISTPQQ